MLDYIRNLSPTPNAVNTLIAVSGVLALLFYTTVRRFLHLCTVLDHCPKGCRKLGLPPGQSNLHDEFDPKYSQGVPETSTDNQGRPAWRVKALYVYPIKSCAGVELDTADGVSTGLALDRQFCFAEDTTTTTTTVPRRKDSCQVQQLQEKQLSNWTARTLRDRNFNRMALIRPEIWLPDPTATDYSADLDEIKSQGVMVIYYPRLGRNRIHSALLRLGVSLHLLPAEESFRVPLFPPTHRIATYPTVPVQIWKDRPVSYDYAQHIPDSLRRYLSPLTRLSSSDPALSSSSSSFPALAHKKHSSRGCSPLTLFRVNPSHHREIFRCAPRKASLGFQPLTGFADAYPLHILSLSSVQDVASRCAADLPRLSVRRFRANIIIQGPPAFAEDDWKRILIRCPCPPPPSASSASSSALETESDNGGQSIQIHTVCRTIRCRLPNVDPDTGVRHRWEPDRTLKRYRRIDRGDPTNACLGMQGVPAVQEFVIRVGDSVSVVERGDHCYIKMLAPGEKIPGV
ncbi:hypothetical protein ARAM_004004 [Aspergillus rambellii]|uniref:MOSC domain-containing protein n=1 Tax=Aspergillus rambellii TaxID=308745 RepID=A0A0F8UTC4_9EURO|nr:hypothetical protein ARAM_004004 [Aspergillus rambellii]